MLSVSTGHNSETGSTSALYRVSQSTNSDSTASNHNNNNNNTNDNVLINVQRLNYSSDSSKVRSGKDPRKPSDRIPSKSRCATFCYNIPRSSLMITIPGFIILAIGAILIATTDRQESWTDGGVLLVSLVFLILGGAWTLCGLVYWTFAWCRYKPALLPANFKRPPSVTAPKSSSNYQPSYATGVFSSDVFVTHPTIVGSASFGSLNSPALYNQQPLQQPSQPQHRLNNTNNNNSNNDNNRISNSTESSYTSSNQDNRINNEILQQHS
ncbi:hypothetical protein HELRODRAFT_194109 [Helobdella robusta]|uniref:Uncharacterized protein n=1 Tax=Helobdella robusta TaxID=6412 RepID=T1FVP5_HELRO|nr:hypothetical protein HELRODRAFT_194109 [Helobdella robusta]ESN93282.1 hypothetical protein HELRODRAFT_194109 [Helobdella robusta]